MRSLKKAVTFWRKKGSRSKGESDSNFSSTLGRMPAEMARRIQWLRRSSSQGGSSGTDTGESDTALEMLTIPEDADQVRTLLEVPEDSWDVFQSNDPEGRQDQVNSGSQVNENSGDLTPTQQMTPKRQLHNVADRRHGRLHIPGHDPMEMFFHGTLEEGRKLGFVSPNAVIHKYESFGIFGLLNIGNTCYMNCVLQCLSNTKPFIEFIIDNHQFFNELTSVVSPPDSAKTRPRLLILCFKDLISTVWKYSPCISSASHAALANVGDTTELKTAIEAKTPMFQGGDQHDAHEFLHCFLDGIHSELNRSRNLKKEQDSDGANPVDWEENGGTAWEKYLQADNSIIIDHFVGQLKSTLICSSCGLQSVKFEPFWDLSVPIIGNTKSRVVVALEDCLQLLLEENTLDQDNLFHCSRCSSQKRCSKLLQIERFPHILVVHLKRFSSQESKILTPVEYPVHGLDMGQFGSNSKQRGGVSYNLFGIVDHIGESHTDGHYVAHCKHPFNYFGNWYAYDDTSVSPVLPSNCSSDAYMLLYEMSLASREILNI